MNTIVKMSLARAQEFTSIENPNAIWMPSKMWDTEVLEYVESPVWKAYDFTFSAEVRAPIATFDGNTGALADIDGTRYTRIYEATVVNNAMFSRCCEISDDSRDTRIAAARAYKTKYTVPTSAGLQSPE